MAPYFKLLRAISSLNTDLIMNITGVSITEDGIRGINIDDV